MIRYLSASKIRCFKECRKKYYFRYVENLEPVRKALPLALGRAVHTGLEFLDSGKTIQDAEDAIMLQYDDWPAEDIGILPTHALAIVNGYNEYSPIDWEVIGMENSFTVSAGKGRRLVGFFDGIIRRNGKLFLLERKTARVVDSKYLNGLLWDEQASLYAYAAKELNLKISGILYDIIQKASIRQKKTETQEQFVTRLQEWYKDPSRYTRHLVTRNSNQIEALSKDVRDIALDMSITEKEKKILPQSVSL